MSKPSKFAGLAAQVADAFRVKLIDPVTDEPITDKAGKEAYVEVLSMDSEVGRKFDREQRQKTVRRAARGRSQELIEDDQLEVNIAKTAALTTGWYLVDPSTREVIDVPCSRDAALELYSEPGLTWLYRQVWVEAINTANFIKRSSKT